MKVALFIGDHAADDLLTRTGWWLTRLAQKGEFGRVTHTEAIHAEHADGSVTIASSSIRDGGVRAKRAMLDPGKWQIVRVPQWDVARSIELLAHTNGLPYDKRGALATVLPGRQQDMRWFCSEWVAAPFLKAPGTFGPHMLAAVALSLGSDVTDDFFWSRK